MRAWFALVGTWLLASGCATGPSSTPEEAAYFSDCRDSAPDGAEAVLRFAGSRYQRQWQRLCDRAALRVFSAPGGEGSQERLVTLARYPPDAEPRRTLDAYIARSASRRVAEPRIFERQDAGPATRYIAELMLQRETPGELAYLLHGVSRSDAGRVVSVTYTHRFAAANDAGLARIKAEQGAWVRALERHLDDFPTLPKGRAAGAD